MSTEAKSNEQNDDLSSIHKTIYCLRHAQSEYNEAIRSPKTWMNRSFWMNWLDPKIRDPSLSQTGIKQTNLMANKLDECSLISQFGIELIITSPLQRAIDTMYGVLMNQMHTIKANNISILAHHDLREWVDTLSDIGTEKIKLRQMYQHKEQQIDFSMIDNECWWNQNVQNGVKKETKQSVNERISSFKHWILQREENNILVVGHSRFFKEFVGAMFKMPNCGMMKVEMHGMKVKKWEYVDFDKVDTDKNKINQIIEQTKNKNSL